MSLNKISFYNLLALLVWLPLPLGSNRIWAWGVVGIWVSIITALTALGYRHEKLKFPTNRIRDGWWIFLPLVASQIWVFVQLLPMKIGVLDILSPLAAETYESSGLDKGTISLDLFATTTSLIKGVIYTLFAFCTTLLVSDKKRVRVVLITLVLSGTTQALYAVMEILLQWDYTPVFGMEISDRANGTFVYHNHLANYLLLCLCLGIGLLISQLHVSASGSVTERIRRWIEGMLSGKMLIRSALVIMVIALVMTKSRMGNTAFFLATLIGGITTVIFYKRKPRALIALVISLFVVDTLVVGSIFGLDKVKDRLENTAFISETRDEVVSWSIDIIQAAPYTGTGMGSYYGVLPAYSKANVGFYDHAHNDYIQFTTELGVITSFLLGLMIAYGLFICIKTVKNRHSRTFKGTAIGCYMATLAMLVHISVDFNLQAPANTMMFVLILVLINCSYSLNAINRV